MKKPGAVLRIQFAEPPLLSRLEDLIKVFSENDDYLPVITKRLSKNISKRW